MPRIIRPVVNKQKRVFGIDASLSSTGFAYRTSTGVITGKIDTKGMTGPRRLAYVLNCLHRHISAYDPDLFVLEDYAMGIGKGGMAFHIGELGGVIKHDLWNTGFDVMIVSPTALKKAITGRGNADASKKVNGKKVKDKSKPEMRAALLESFGLAIHQPDEADAAGLMLMGEMRFGSHTVTAADQSKLRLDSLNECSIIQGRKEILKTFATKNI